MRLPRSRRFYVVLAALALAVVATANAHLMFVANQSRPRCLEHVKPGETGSGPVTFSAAKPSC